MQHNWTAIKETAGAGALRHTKTYPKALQRICSPHLIPVLLVSLLSSRPRCNTYSSGAATVKQGTLANGTEQNTTGRFLETVRSFLRTKFDAGPGTAWRRRCCGSSARRLSARSLNIRWERSELLLYIFMVFGWSSIML